MRPESSALPQIRAGEPAGNATPFQDFAVPDMILIDGPTLPGSQTDIRPILAGIGTPWPGPISVSAGPVDVTSSERAVISAPAGIGRLIAPLPAGPLGRWDEAADLVLEMPGERFASLSENAALSASVPLLIAGDGHWELIAYRDAELIGPDQYRLNGLLRGLQGSVIAKHDVGAVCALVDGRLVRGGIASDEIGLEMRWQAAGRGLFGEQQLETYLNNAGLAFAPVHLRMNLQESGNMHVSWVRRGPDISTSWIAPEQPNQGRYHVSLHGDDGLIFETDVDQPHILIESGELIRGVIDVREYGPDGRMGHAAKMSVSI